MRLLLFSFLFTIPIFSQTKPIEIKLTSITSKEINDKNSIYTIDYQIENTTSNSVSFFLLPNALIANTTSSLTLFTVYKMYQNGVFEDMDGPFFEFETDDELTLATIEDIDSHEYKKLLKTIQTNQAIVVMNNYKKYQENGGKNTDFRWVYYNQKILNNVITLNPNETRNFTIKTIWDKNRYIKNDNLEYYLDENSKIEIELILELKTNLFKDNLSEEDLVKINANPHFINGTFTSNKMEIIFKD